MSCQLPSPQFDSNCLVTFQPSVFNGPEITMPKDLIHFGGWEHRDIHNINGMFLPRITSEGLIKRGETSKRPFVLTRSFFAGSQRYGAMWTGDNLGTWEHMTVGIKMVLANGIAGMTFAGGQCLFSLFLFFCLLRVSALYHADMYHDI
jgi:alpha-glucosidase (family GH31 glycosyl hydrolase)